jgi:hypothetical protein
MPALFTNAAQGSRGGKAFCMLLQFGQVLLIQIDHGKQVLFSAITIRRRGDQALCLKQITIQQEVCDRLVIVGIGAAYIRTDQDTRFYRNGLLGG